MPFRIVTNAPLGRFGSRIVYVQFGMIALSLEHCGTLIELPRLTKFEALLFTFAGRRLIHLITALVRHIHLP